MAPCPHGLEHPDHTCYDRWCHNECAIPTEKDKKIESLEAKIKEANKVLAELDISNFATGEERKDGTEYHNFNIDKWYERMKASLCVEDSKETS